MVNARTIYLVENLRFLSFLLCEGETRVNFLPSVPVNLVQLFIYIFYLDQSRRINNTLSSIPADNVLYFSGSLSLIMFFGSIGSGSVVQFLGTNTLYFQQSFYLQTDRASLWKGATNTSGLYQQVYLTYLLQFFGFISSTGFSVNAVFMPSLDMVSCRSISVNFRT